jgi:hypothetical protein
LREAKGLVEEDLLDLPGVRGVGIGYKVVGGKETTQLAVVVLVESKVGESRLDPRSRVPERLTFITPSTGREVTVVTDVQESPGVVPAVHVPAFDPQLNGRLRPTPGGASIGTPSGSGTLGGWAVDNTTGRYVFLSNRHVIGSTPGTLVGQPLLTSTENRFGTVLRGSTNFDAAIGEPFSASDVNPEIYANAPAIYELVRAALGMEVEKTGRTTGHTEGRVTLVDVTPSDPECRFRHSFGIIPTATTGLGFIQQGDSGSLIVERTHPNDLSWKRVVGLVFCAAPDGSVAYAHEITDVFADLNLITICEALGELIDVIFLSAAATGVSGRGFARDVEMRLTRGRVGNELVETLKANRVSMVKVLLDGDGRRALEAALAPLLSGAVVTDDLLERVISDEDAHRFTRLLDVAERVIPDERRLLGRAREILGRTRNRRLRSVLLDDADPV